MGVLQIGIRAHGYREQWESAMVNGYKLIQKLDQWLRIVLGLLQKLWTTAIALVATYRCGKGERAHICDGRSEDYTIEFGTCLTTNGPDNSLSMGDENLDTIPTTESDEVIKSSVEDLVLIPSESEGIPDSVCDVPLCNNPTPLEAFKEHSKTVVEIVIPEVEDSDDYSSNNQETISIALKKLCNVNLLIANIEALKDNPTPSSDFHRTLKLSAFGLERIEVAKNSGSTTTQSDISLCQYDSFIFDLSINPFPLADRSDFNYEEFVGELAHIISPPEYDHFCFKNEPEMGNLTMDVDCLDSEASRARGFVIRSQELHILSFILGIRYPNLID
ncbi:hypothetical protein Tco_0723766 [Tanacetum coccineum]